MHTEVTPPGQRQPLGCACGFLADGAREFDDHILLATIPPDSTGSDGDKHVPVDPSTPDRGHIRKASGE